MVLSAQCPHAPQTLFQVVQAKPAPMGLSVGRVASAAEVG